MIKRIESVCLFSHNAKKLANFYKTKVGLKISDEAVFGENDEELYELKFGKEPFLYIVDHSKIKGNNKNPERFIINMEVDNIDKEVEKLKKNKVKVIAEKYHMQSYGYIATFEDLDGNYFQLVQVRPD